MYEDIQVLLQIQSHVSLTMANLSSMSETKRDSKQTSNVRTVSSSAASQSTGSEPVVQL